MMERHIHNQNQKNLLIKKDQNAFLSSKDSHSEYLAVDYTQCRWAPVTMEAVIMEK